MISEDEVKDLAVASDPPVLSSDPNYSSPESHQAPSRAHCDGFKNKRRKHFFFFFHKEVCGEDNSFHYAWMHSQDSSPSQFTSQCLCRLLEVPLI